MPSSKRDGHASFAGDQADVADGVVAEVAWILTQIGAHAAARPVAQQTLARPVILGVKGAGAADDVFELAGALGMLAEPAAQGGADGGRHVDAVAEGAVGEVADQGFLFLVAERGPG